MSIPRVRALAALGLLLLGCSACGPRYVRQQVYFRNDVEVRLRAETREGELVPRGFAHPAPIAPVRLAHILARVDRRKGEGDQGERAPAVPTELIYDVADALAQGLSAAGPDQEVVVLAQRRTRHLALFTRRRLTSFVAWVEGDRLHLDFGHLDWLLDREVEEDPPEPFPGQPVMKFRIVPGEAMVASGRQSVAVDWRDPLFRKAGVIRFSPGGKLIRRTILAEEPPEPERRAEPALPSDVSPETLRALADLEEARRAGKLTESEYQARRRELLSGPADR